MTLHDGQTFTHRGYTFRVTFPYDDDTTPPWKRSDGHGPVSEWRPLEGWDGRMHKAPVERILVKDRTSARFYDVQEAMRMAVKDGWGTIHCQVCGAAAKWADDTTHAVEPADHHAFVRESRRQTAAHAVEQDFELLRGWCADEWQYVDVVVTRLDEHGDETDDTESLSGIESNADAYLEDTARTLADEIVTRLEVEHPLVQLSEN